MPNTSASAIALAKSQVGYHESRSGGHWTNLEKYAAQVPGLAWANGYAWCMTFVCWVLHMTGAMGKLTPTAAVYNMLQQGKKLGRFTEYPTIGAIAIYGRSGNVHTGIVTAYTGTYIWAVEGNTNDNGSAEGDGVYYKQRQRKSSYVYGYVLPYYDEYATSADPAWDGKWLGLNPEPRATVAKSSTIVPARTIAPTALWDGAGRPISFSNYDRGVKSGKPTGNVKLVQAMLQRITHNKTPYYSGPLDGVAGPKMREAISTFQRGIGDDVDGELGPLQFAKLVQLCNWKAVK